MRTDLRIRLTLAAGAVAMAVSGCGGPKSEPPKPQEQPTKEAPSAAAKEQGVFLKRPTAETRRLVGNATSAPWTLREVNGATLTLRIKETGCLPFVRLAVHEGPKRVLIASLVRPVALAKDEVCPAVITERDVDLLLTHPLGDRTLVHAPVDPELAD